MLTQIVSPPTGGAFDAAQHRAHGGTSRQVASQWKAFS